MSGPLEVGVDARRRHRGVLVSDVVCQDEDVLQMSLPVPDVVIKERFDVEAKPAEHGVGRLLRGNDLYDHLQQPLTQGLLQRMLS